MHFLINCTNVFYRLIGQKRFEVYLLINMYYHIHDTYFFMLFTLFKQFILIYFEHHCIRFLVQTWLLHVKIDLKRILFGITVFTFSNNLFQSSCLIKNVKKNWIKKINFADFSVQGKQVNYTSRYWIVNKHECVNIIKQLMLMLGLRVIRFKSLTLQ